MNKSQYDLVTGKISVEEFIENRELYDPNELWKPNPKEFNEERWIELGRKAEEINDELYKKEKRIFEDNSEQIEKDLIRTITGDFRPEFSDYYSVEDEFLTDDDLGLYGTTEEDYDV